MEVVHSWHFTIGMLNCFQIEVLVRWMVELAGQTLIAKCGLSVVSGSILLLATCTYFFL